MNIDVNSTISQAVTAKIGAFGSVKNMSAEKADIVSKDFESLFISQMLEQMFGESSGSNAFGTSDTDEVYKGLMVQEYGKIISQSGGIGIAQNIKAELLKQQEI
ncbi:MAG: rod-binding protein [Rickettsiales bacterium]|jgi:flagellar protein FlgJ